MWKSLKVSKFETTTRSMADMAKELGLSGEYKEPVLPVAYGSFYVEELPMAIVNGFRVHCLKNIPTRCIDLNSISIKVVNDRDPLMRIRKCPINQLRDLKFARDTPLKKYKATYTNKGKTAPVYVHDLFPELKTHTNNVNVFYLSAGVTLDVSFEIAEMCDCEDPYRIVNGEMIPDAYNTQHRFAYQLIVEDTTKIYPDIEVEKGMSVLPIARTGVMIQTFPTHSDPERATNIEDLWNIYSNNSIEFYTMLKDNIDSHVCDVGHGKIEMNYKMADRYVHVIHAYLTNTYGNKYQIDRKHTGNNNKAQYEFTNLGIEECKKVVTDACEHLIKYFDAITS
jgi:hypothetical protein